MTLVSIPANPVPDNTVAGMLKTKDGVRLRFARFAPPPGRKGTVCLFQGRAEFIEKYFETVRDLRARGFAVATIDWRGQGGSQRTLRDPFKGHVRDFAEYETDVEVFMREIVLPDCPPPHYAIAHSMGASVLLRMSYKGQRWFDRMVMSAPMIGLSTKTYPRFAQPAMKVMRMFGMSSSYIPGGDATVMAAQSYHRQSGDDRSGAACAHGRDPGGAALARSRCADGRLGGGGVRRHGSIRGTALHVQSAPADGAGRGRARRRSSRPWRPRNSGCGCAPARISSSTAPSTNC